jgi:hypothetical protein
MRRRGGRDFTVPPAKRRVPPPAPRAHTNQSFGFDNTTFQESPAPQPARTVKDPLEQEDELKDELIEHDQAVPSFVGINLHGVQVLDEDDDDDDDDDDDRVEESAGRQDSTAVLARISEAGQVDAFQDVERSQNPTAALADVGIDERRDASPGLDLNEHNPNPNPNPDTEAGELGLDLDPLPDTPEGLDNPSTPFSYFDGPQPDDIPVDEFHLAVLTFMTSCDLSQAMYQAFREIMAFATPKSIQTLPATLVTLKRRARRNMPIMRLRGYEVGIDSTKVPPKSVIPQRGYRFEIQDYAKRWLADDRMMRSMHFGLGYLPSDSVGRREFYQGDAWLGSVRTTSGEFAYLNGEPLLPSDCVSHISLVTGRRVFLQVFGTGVFGHPDDGVPKDQKQLGILARRLIPPWELPAPWDWSREVSQYADTVDNSNHPSCLHAPFIPAESSLPELVLMEEDRLVFSLEQLDRKEWIHFLDHSSADTLRASLLPVDPTYCVRHIAYTCNGSPRIRNVHQRHRIPAEHELLDMGRQHILDTFVGPGRISLPFTLFLDAFGLHRNVYHQLQGLYMQPANMDAPGRFTMQNCFVLMLGPFGGNDSDIAQCLEDETVPLGRGIRTTIVSSDGSIHTNVLTAFPLCMSGDMPQQNHNVGTMSPAANFNCRYCFTGERGNLRLDVRVEGRYQAAHSHLRDQLDMVAGKRNKTQVFSRCGINETEGPIFAKCFPCLDIFNGYPNDPFHCELRLAKYFQEALVHGLLSEEGQEVYGEVWNQIDVPYGWSVPLLEVSPIPVQGGTRKYTEISVSSGTEKYSANL